MIQEIKYSGITTNPSDYESPDGSLALSLNLIHEDGSLKPIPAPSTLMQLQPSQSVAYIHKGNNYTNYIILTTTPNALTLSHATSVTTPPDAWAPPFLTLPLSEPIVSIQAIGNMLIVSTTLHLHYILFANSAYTHLGTQLPRVPMSFALSAQLVSTDHTAALSFSDHTSSESTWQSYAATTFEADMLRSSSAAYITATYARDVPVGITRPLQASTEYKLQVSGSGFTSLHLYARTSGSSAYEQIAVINNGATVMLKPTATYTSFKADIFQANGGVPSYHASGSIKVLSGFQGTVSGKVLAYNSDNYNAIAAAINKFVAEQATQKNKFIYPFFIRYALRLYDGSHARISDPILMIPNSAYAPFVQFTEGSDKLSLYAFIADLQYLFHDTIDTKWRDIISGIDIFLSPQVYPYNQGDEFNPNANRFSYAIINKSSGIDQITATNYGYCSLPHLSASAQYGYAKHDLCQIAKETLGFADTTKRDDWRIVKLAPADDVMQKLQSTSQFYLVHSFDFDEIKAPEGGFGNEMTTFSLHTGVLSSLVTRATLADDPLSNCAFLNAHLTTYNQRLHLFNYSMRHPAPTAPSMQNGHIYRYDSYGRLQSIQVHIRTSQGERVVQYTPADSDNDSYASSTPWFFYPHNSAYKAVMVFKPVSSESLHIATLNLKQCPLLNGAYWMADSIDGSILCDTIASTYTPPAASDTSTYPNSVLQSLVSSPFVLPSSLMVTLGVERIISMSSAAKALSQGQFGQFPLYAFTTQGVWALEVSATGTYTAKQPITRDVCPNPLAITQLDSAVLFPTTRGIMLISGSQTQCISEPLNSGYPFDPRLLPAFPKLYSMLGQDYVAAANNPVVPFTQFLMQCRMIYDYVHQRVIVYTPGIQHAYVYSLRNNQWGMILLTSPLAATINSYPEALAVDKDSAVLNFSAPGSSPVKCLLITRPLKLQAPDVLKTVDTIIQRGLFPIDSVSTVLYGSRDLLHWHLVASSRNHYLAGFRGSPYKYFRIAALATLAPDQDIHGASVQFTPRYTDKLR